jgi:hypothetical protein
LCRGKINQSFRNLKKNSALECISGKKRNKKLGKLQIWNKSISDAYKEMKKASFKW